MRRGILLLLFLGGPLGGLISQDVEIRDFQVTGNLITQESFIKQAFLEVPWGRTIPEKQALEVLDWGVRRLEDTGYFSQVEAHWETTAPGVCGLRVQITEAWGLRGGLGLYYGVLGLVNLGGRAKDLTLGAGWRMGYLSFQDHFTWIPGGFYSFTFNTQGLMGPGSLDLQGLSGQWEGGIQLPYGWETSIFIQQGYYYQVNQGLNFWDTQQGLSLGYKNTRGGYSPSQGLRLRTNLSFFLPEFFLRESLDLRIYLSPGAPWLKTAWKIRGEFQQNTPADRWEHQLSLSGPGSLRKLPGSQESGTQKLIFSGELRSRWLDFIFLDFLGVQVEGAVIGDVGGILGPQGFQWSWDAGGALRIFLLQPLNTPINLEYTWDPLGRGFFSVSLTAPF